MKPELDKHEQRDADIRKMVAMRDEMQRKIAATDPKDIVEQRAQPMEPGDMAISCLRRLARCNINNPQQRDLAGEDIRDTLEMIDKAPTGLQRTPVMAPEQVAIETERVE